MKWNLSILISLLCFSFTQLGCGKRDKDFNVSIFGLYEGLSLAELGAQVISKDIQSTEDLRRKLDDWPVSLNNESKKSLKQLYKNKAKEKDVYYWELVDRNIRKPHYCHQECKCIATKIASEFKSKNPDNVVLAIHIYRKGLGGIATLVGKEKRKAHFFFHYTVLVIDPNGGLNFFDPVLFHDTEIHSFSEWYERIVDIENLKFTVSLLEDKSYNYHGLKLEDGLNLIQKKNQ